MSNRPTVVIVGAGFAGLYAAKALRKAPVDVLLIDQQNYHTFQPLLYQVATAQLEQDEIAHTIRATFQKQRNFRFRQGTVVGVDWDAKEVALRSGAKLPFDYLILGTGAVYSDFGVPGVKEHAFFLKSLTEAVTIRSHLLRQFEHASARPELIDEGVLNVVIVGGGPTGVELAGALVELFDRVLPRDYPHLEVDRARVILLEMMDALLLPFHPKSQKHAERVLRDRGVDIRLGEAVSEVRADAAVLKSGDVIPTRTLIWAAGVRGSPLVDALGLELTRGARVAVEPDLSVPGRPFAFVAGDVCGATDEDGKMYPQVAQVAIQQGKHAAKQILARVRQEPPEPFRYHDRGIMAIVGRNSGVAELSKQFGGFRFRGFLGWLAWLFIHLVYLPGYQNRFNAFANWVYGYFTWDRHARLITDMAPSPSEIANRTLTFADDDEIAEVRDRGTKSRLRREEAPAESGGPR